MFERKFIDLENFCKFNKIFVRFWCKRSIVLAIFLMNPMMVDMDADDDDDVYDDDDDDDDDDGGGGGGGDGAGAYGNTFQ